MFTPTAPNITDREYQKAVKYTHPSTGMTYIRVKGAYYFSRTTYRILGRNMTGYKKSGALGGFQLLK
jgi:hypothetical protein